MAKPTIINQPLDGQLGNYLIENLESSKFKKLNIVVAFAKNSGVLRLKNALSHFIDHGGLVNMYVGIDLGGTSYEALLNLYNYSTELYVVHLESEQTFHSKIYNFVSDSDSILIIGSNNLTSGGLWTNLESYSIVELLLSDKNDVTLQEDIDSYIRNLKTIERLSFKIEDTEDIDKLLDNGYIEKEAHIHIREASRKQLERNTGTKPSKSFAKRLAAYLPKISSPENRSKQIEYIFINHEQQSPAILPPNNVRIDTVWFETRALTGGSRNILDLSKVSLVKKGNPYGTPFYSENATGQMRGGVCFFDIDPDKVDAELDLTINFNGVDYFGNTIKYPKGNKANGTWRLQIKGVSKNGTKITESVQNDYFTHKILAFTKIDTSYYYLSVFDESDLGPFIEASKIVAYNGKRIGSKMFGLW